MQNGISYACWHRTILGVPRWFVGLKAWFQLLWVMKGDVSVVMVKHHSSGEAAPSKHQSLDLQSGVALMTFQGDLELIWEQLSLRRSLQVTSLSSSKYVQTLVNSQTRVFTVSLWIHVRNVSYVCFLPFICCQFFFLSSFEQERQIIMLKLMWKNKMPWTSTAALL